MCGIIISTLEIPEKSFKYIKNRGPDYTNILKINNINFVHFLLHLTGKKTPQPIKKDNIVIIFNGEIYNYKDIYINAESDIYSILYAYQKYGENFIKYIDGEFTIVIFDFNKNLLFISSDIFKTKPLFYHISNENIIISSYLSSCIAIKDIKYQSIKPNELLVFDLKTKNLIKKINVYTFDLKQYKTNYDDYIKAFEKSVLKRYPEKNIPVIALSSGLDSGSIACCLNKYNKKALYISYNKNENIEVLNKRKEILKDSNFIIINLNDNEKKKIKEHLNNNCEKCIWDWKYNPNIKNKIQNALNQGSNIGKSKIFNITNTIDEQIKILLSGIGGDEIMARNKYYSRGYGQVNKFTKNLIDIFPWPNFFGGTMRNYILSDEYVGGCHSFETRYPFCDKDLVQEYLWLKYELKNNNIISGTSFIKPCLAHYLKKNNFPFHLKKMGFNI